MQITLIHFQATEDKLKEYFSQYGQLTDVKILRHQNGRLVGCGFVEYSFKNSAAKAIAHASGKPFLSKSRKTGYFNKRTLNLYSFK